MATKAAAPPGIAPGQLVRIAVPGRERATASVTHVTGAWFALRLVGVGGPRPKDLHGVRAAVEYIGDDGMRRVQGDIEPGDGSPSALRFVLRSGVQFLGRRHHVRTALEVPVVLTLDRTGEKLRGRTVNVSEGGMLVEDLGAVLPGAGERLRFALAPRGSRDPIFGTALVTRADAAAGLLALTFEPFARAARDELARIVFENEQGTRALRR